MATTSHFPSCRPVRSVPIAGVPASGSPMAGDPQGRPPRPDRRPARSPVLDGRRGLHLEPLLRRAGPALSRPSRGRALRHRARILVNTGNANAGTGAGRPGREPARPAPRWPRCIRLRSRARSSRSPPASSWRRCPSDRIEAGAGLPRSPPPGRRPLGAAAAEAIMTTDTVPKAASAQVDDRRQDGHASPASARAPA